MPNIRKCSFEGLTTFEKQRKYNLLWLFDNQRTIQWQMRAVIHTFTAFNPRKILWHAFIDSTILFGFATMLKLDRICSILLFSFVNFQLAQWEQYEEKNENKIIKTFIGSCAVLMARTLIHGTLWLLIKGPNYNKWTEQPFSCHIKLDIINIMLIHVPFAVRELDVCRRKAIN